MLKRAWVALVVLFGTLGVAYALFVTVPQEYAPAEDQGMIFAYVSTAEGSSIERMKSETAKLEATAMPYVERGDARRLLVFVPGWGGSSANSGMLMIDLAPIQDRDIATADMARDLTKQWQDIPSIRAFAFSRSGLSKGGGDQPIQFVVGGPDYETLARWRDILLEKIDTYPGIARIDADLKETQPQVHVRIDKNRAASLGVSVQNIGRTLSAMMSEQRITTYIQDGEEYDVILQARADQRATARDLENIYVRSERSGELIPLANLIYTEQTAGAASLNRYNRLRAITLSGSLAPGYSLGDVLGFLEDTVQQELPQTAQIDYRGESLDYKEASSSLLFTFGLALVIVFLVLAAQFESFVHPLVILITVPLAVAGGLFGLYATGLTLNIYSQIGIILLVGIAAKNGVLIVEFINQLRDSGREFEDAIVEAAAIRLRPVLMTTISTVMGSVPLIMAMGAGAESRHVLGVVIFSGVSVATLLTLFMVPALYRLVAHRSGSPELIANELEQLQAQHPNSKEASSASV